MDAAGYRKLLKRAPFGYAHHRIIIDEQGIPVDYQFIEINDRFAKLTGLDGQAVAGSLVTEVIPGITEDEFDWIGFYGNVALKNCEESFEQYSQKLGRWYKVYAYSPAPYDFVTFFLT
ncbi:PAS domain-containing protein [Desulfosalsimonas propionicica]|uniref:PAS domain-containing protein n=1 Tax=Desulfosalsimonas propionicica TaxID=332175 RepID=A0A7W0HKP5_9BACT|nr:hypothetical protein [Desulfosalsimonas propionicica]MBA2881494.1 PAS domain-containing protein [Desulfosalsimonas propionicica]